MMISPESYIELEIKGRTPEEICSKIRGLQRDMAQLKNKAENNKSFEDVVICPTPQVQIEMIREYITAARNYLAELGYDYPLSKM